MSASSTPTLSPLALRASARLAATVDLPTPPLPEATATMASTPGTPPPRPRIPAGGACGCARGSPRARRALGGQYRGHRQDPGQRLDRLLRRLAQRFETRSALGIDLDRKGDVAVADCDARYHPEADDVAVSVGVANMPQRLKDLLFGDGGHLWSPPGDPPRAVAGAL